MKLFLTILLGSLLLFSCRKEEEVPCPVQPITPKWEKFIGNYKVYDTLGSFLYSMNISHFSGVNQFGNNVDSLLFQNFIDKFDLKIEFYNNHLNENTLNYGFYDSLADKFTNHWYIGSEFDDTSSVLLENTLINDTIIFYYKLTNIKYYLAERVPYFYCECKQVAVKQN